MDGWMDGWEGASRVRDRNAWNRTRRVARKGGTGETSGRCTGRGRIELVNTEVQRHHLDAQHLDEDSHCSRYELGLYLQKPCASRTCSSAAPPTHSHTHTHTHPQRDTHTRTHHARAVSLASILKGLVLDEHVPSPPHCTQLLLTHHKQHTPHGANRPRVCVWWWW